jgi:chitodextrinase
MRKAAVNLIILLSVLTGSRIFAQETSPFSVVRLPVNLSAYSEISPVIFKDGILFCSDRRLRGIVERTSFDNRRLYNIYYAEKKDSSDWGKPDQLNSERTSLFNSGPLCLAPDGETIWFTSEIETGIPSRSRKFRNRSGIFSAKISGSELISIEPFIYNSQEYDIGQPSISADGKYIYFASDMPGGEGKSDIYYCELTDGKWSEPINLGPGINSPETDNFPCINISGRLYFSSDRPGGNGGLDVYYTDLVDGEWQNPVILLEPVNSSSDDFAFVPQPDLQSGYFASNRRRNDDIYEFKMTIVRKSQCNPLEINNYCYEFIEENAVKYDTIPFSYEWKFGDGSTENGKSVEHCYPGPGKYLIQLDVTNMVTNETTYNQKSQMLVVEDIVQPYINCIDEASTGEQLMFSADSTNLPGWEISSYYWNFGDETIAIGKNVSKTFQRPGNYNIQLIVTANPGEDGTQREACVSKNIKIIQ